MSSLRTSLADLRRALGPEAVRLRSPTPHSLSFDLAGAEADVVTFDQAIARAATGLEPGATTPAIGVSGAPGAGDPHAWLEQAIALYRGPLLEGCTEAWAFQERQAREQAYLTALEALATEAMAHGDPAAAERHVRRVVALDPLRETAQRALMRALAAGGNYAAAILAYRELRLHLHRELNADPDPETQALFQQIRSEAQRRCASLPQQGDQESVSSSRLAAAGLEPGASEYRGHDPGAPDRVFLPRPVTALHTYFAPLHAPGPRVPTKWVDPCAPAPSNLPQAVTSFIGRGRQMAEVRQLLGTTRLLTLTGAGGTGKTRLSLQMAAELLPEYPDGVWLVELAPLSDPAMLPHTLASLLGVREEPGKPLVQTLVDDLRPRTLLLLLDNCEHLLTAGATLAEALLRGCPEVQLLATSREGLNIAGETTYRLPSLSLPDPQHLPAAVESLAEYEAVRLFVDRAVAAVPSFTLTHQNAPAVAQICYRLDGIPLAIELAAARVKALPVEKIAERLDDSFHLLTSGSRTALTRHQTLRALIDWSYDLLTPPERMLLRRLSVFAGGWTLEAAEAVCADARLESDPSDPSDPSAIRNPQSAIRNQEVLDLLIRLVEKSLVLYDQREGSERYRLLETVRQYARDRLLETGEEAAVRDQHLDFFLAMAEQSDRRAHGPEFGSWLDQLEREHDNLRAALRWSQERGASLNGDREAVRGLRLGTALFSLWQTRGYRAEGREHMAALLRLPGAAARSTDRARALSAAGALAGDHDAAWAFCQESLTIARELNDPECIAGTLISMGNVACSQGELRTAWELCQESLAIGRALNDLRVLAWSLFTLGNVEHYQGNYSVAQAHYQESLAIWRKDGDRRSISSVLNSLGEMAHRQGDYQTAQALHEESLAIKRELQDRLGIAACLSRLGNVALSRADYATARDLCEQSLAVYRELGERAGIAWLLNSLARVAYSQGDDAAARSFLEESLCLWRELGDRRWGLAECLEELARVLTRQGQPGRAARLLGAASALLGDSAAPRPPSEQTEYDRLLTDMRARLGEAVFTAAAAAGRAMTWEQIVADAAEERF